MTHQFMKVRSITILILVVAVLYATYFLLFSKRTHEQAKRSSTIARERFFTASLNDTIYRFEPIYGDTCNYEMWIRNYSMDYVLLNVCDDRRMKDMDVNDKILKAANSNECVIEKPGGKKIEFKIEIEY